MNCQRFNASYLTGTFALLFAICCGQAFAQASGGGYTINKSTFAGGGGTSTNGTTQITGTVGQRATGVVSDGTNTIASGFWLGVTCTFTNSGGVITPATLPNGLAGRSYSQMLVGNGSIGPYTFLVTAGSVPTGMSLSTFGVLSGTPSVAGTSNFTVTVTDGFGCTAMQSFSLTIASCPSSFTVNDLGDTSDANAGNGVCADSNGKCTLRAAIEEANAITACSPLTINFSVTGTISLATALPSLNHPNLTISGPGASSLTVQRSTVSGTGNFRIFTVNSGKTVAISGLTITNGKLSGPNSGAGIKSSGTLSLTDCVISGNTGSDFGGGIASSFGGSLTVTRCAISGNTATAGGGGINTSTTIVISDSTISGNTAGNQGGGLDLQNVTATLTNCTVSGNVVSDGYGGGVHLLGLSGASDLTLTNCTITGNTSSNGAGIRLNANPGAVSVVAQLKNALITGNTGVNFFANGSATSITSQGNNLDSDGTSGFTNGSNGDLVGTSANPLNALLASLGNYGGMTQTHALLPGSPAINTGTASGAPTNDQRGSSRVGAVDIGAFESQGFTLAIASGNNQSAVISAAFTNPLSATVTANVAAEPVNGGQVIFTPPVSGASAGVVGSPATIASGAATSGTVTANGTTGSYSVAASANGASPVNFSLMNVLPNNPPTITPIAQTVTQGSSQTLPIATVSDAETLAGNLTVMATSVPAGISVTGITNSSGNISALVAATCGATIGDNTVVLTVSDENGGMTTGNLILTVTANTAPTLSYAASTIGLGGSTSINPTTATDNGSITGYSIVSVTPAMTVAPTVNSSGVVSISNAGALGSHTIVVQATDNCGATTNASFTLNVITCSSITVTPTTLLNGLAGVSFGQTLSATGGSGSYTFSLASGTLPAGLSLNDNMIVGIPTTAGASTFTIRATDGISCFGERSYTLVIGSTGLMYYPLARPVRLLDTRSGASPNACNQPNAQITGGTSLVLTARGNCDGITIPANATTLTGNVTVVQPTGNGFLTLFPSDVPQPTVASSNFLASEVLNNAFTVGLGASDGAFKIFVNSTTNVVIDVTGYYAPPTAGGLYFHPLPQPIRLLETRQGFTGCQTPGVQLQAGSTRLQTGVLTCSGVTIPVGAQALVGNATTTNTANNGYLTLYPADASQPFTASSNYVAGVNRNAPFTVGLSLNGEFNIYTAATTDLVIDVMGYFSAQASDTNGQGLLFNSLGSPLRLMDTRAGQTACYTPGAQMIGGTAYLQETQVPCSNLTATARGLVGNVSTVNAAANGFLTFWPSNAAQPTVATSNYQTGRVFNRHFTVGLGADIAFKRYTSSTTDLIIDISGFFAP